jgi:ribonuclease E
MLVHVGKRRTQVAILENGTLVEHYVSRKDHTSIAGNIYYGRVQNVLPGMEAAFVDIGTSRNGVLYIGDVQWDEADIDVSTKPRIEEVLSKGDPVLVQVTKDPMGTKGPRLTTQITLPGRFVVLVPQSDVHGISRRLPESERERLRRIAKRVKPEGFGIIIRTAAMGAPDEHVAAEIERLSKTWFEIYEKALTSKPPKLVYAEPEIVVRVFRETFGPDFKRVVVDDEDSYHRILEALELYAPDFKDKVELYPKDEPLPLFEKYHIIEQLHKALSRKVWLPSGGHIVIDRTEALTVIDVNTGKNVGKSNLEETVFQNNLEAAEEISRQLRLRDIGGIVIIDFIDMEMRKNREQVLQTFRECLARDRTRTQVFEISELGLLEMTRKNVSEGLLEAFSRRCDHCEGRGVILESPEDD